MRCEMAFSMMRFCALSGLLVGNSSAAFICPMHRAPLSRARGAAPRANEFDVWWANRRSQNIMQQVPARAPALDTLQLDVNSVTIVFKEFVQSDYARQLCNRYNVQPTDYGQIQGMFDSVQLVDTKLVVRLSPTFDERNTALLDRLSRYLRVRIPQLNTLQALHRDGLDIY